MKIRETSIKGSFLIDLELKHDERGFFSRLFCAKEFTEKGLEGKIVNVNNSKSSFAKTLRGLHYQLPPFEETKLVRCIKGSLFDVVLDLRPSSLTFGKWFGEILNEDNRTMVYVPKGCAHGFLTLTPETEMIYCVSEIYSSTHERGIRYNDPHFNIPWPFQPQIISERDRSHPDYSFPNS